MTITAEAAKDGKLRKILGFFFCIIIFSTICAELNFDYEKSIQIATFCLFLKKGVVGK